MKMHLRPDIRPARSYVNVQDNIRISGASDASENSISDTPDIGKSGFSDFWKSGFSEIRKSGNLKIRIFGLPEIRIFGNRISEIPENPKIQVFGHSDVPDFRDNTMQYDCVASEWMSPIKSPRSVCLFGIVTKADCDKLQPK